MGNGSMIARLSELPLSLQVRVRFVLAAQSKRLRAKLIQKLRCQTMQKEISCGKTSIGSAP